MMPFSLEAPWLVHGLLAGFVAGNAYQIMQAAPSTRLRLVAQADGSDTAALLAKCGQGDSKAFRKLYETNAARLYGVALRITRNPTLASDAVHDAMLQVWRNSDRYDPERGNAGAWLVSLVRYRALDIARKQGREITGLEMPEQADDEPDVLSRLVATADGSALKVCLEAVDPPRRKLVILAFIDGLTQNEIAIKTDQPLGTVKSSIRRALLALRSCLDPTGDTPR